MALFQSSVLKRHLNNQDKSTLSKNYKKYCKYFHNPNIQKAIRQSKEEQFQEGFLRELFVNILGYTINPSPKFNLTTEFKNLIGSKKADGAILLKGKAVAVIELKGTKTKDLESIENQAFNYKIHHSDCKYVITSNFEKLRFYINNAVDFQEFNLFTLSEQEFEVLYLCLAQENLMYDKPLNVKNESIIEERKITKKLYDDYSLFKRELYRNLIKKNSKNEVLKSLPEKTTRTILFRKSQKLLDRFLFILFAEDRGLIPTNTISKINDEWKHLLRLDSYTPLYERYKKYFNYLDTGRKGTSETDEIFAYNGGLFEKDAILDAILIDDELLLKHTDNLTAYDFDSNIDVNILGHIFEHSLNEIESVNAQIEGNDFDERNTKRKGDGIFYTPKFITKYIVKSTIGRLCNEKKQQLGIDDSEYSKGRKKRHETTILKLKQQLTDYREWLLELTICDPACGSGAFLNEALDYLIYEHEYIDNLTQQLFGGGFKFPDIENQILERNIYGVDINNESVEIAKLSLWLRTAQPKRKLTSLNQNIKCGNSLVSSKDVAGEKAFDWYAEFPEVFKKGGFDVVIGNPPYVSNKEMHKNGLQNQIEYWNRKYLSAKSGNYDIYVLFVEKCLEILKDNELVSLIIPNKFLIAKYSQSILNLINERYSFEKVIDYSNIKVFPDASVYPIIISLRKKYSGNSLVDRIIVDKGSFEDYSIVRKWNYLSLRFEDKINIGGDAIISKVEKSKKTINSKLTFEPGINGFQFTNYSKCVSEGKIHNNSKRLVVTGNIDPYIFLSNTTRYKKIDYKEPYIRYDQEIISEGKWQLFSKPKVMIAGMTKRIEASLDYNGSYAPGVSVYSICGDIELLKDVLLLLNSRLINWYFKYKFSDKHLAGGYISINNLMLKKIPLKKIDVNNQYAEILSELHSNHELVALKFIKYVQDHYRFSKLTTKLKNWFNYDFNIFINEVNKLLRDSGQKPLTKIQEMDWIDAFDLNKAEIQKIQKSISDYESEIDKIIYNLYGITDDEIKIIENNLM